MSEQTTEELADQAIKVEDQLYFDINARLSVINFFYYLGIFFLLLSVVFELTKYSEVPLSYTQTAISFIVFLVPALPAYTLLYFSIYSIKKLNQKNSLIFLILADIYFIFLYFIEFFRTGLGVILLNVLFFNAIFRLRQLRKAQKYNKINFAIEPRY